MKNTDDVKDGIERQYIECACTSPGHLLNFMWFHEDDDPWAGIFVSTHLDHNFGFFKRIWHGLKYIFGYHCSYGHFDETLLRRPGIIQLRELCETWLEQNPEKENE